MSNGLMLASDLGVRKCLWWVFRRSLKCHGCYVILADLKWCIFSVNNKTFREKKKKEKKEEEKNNCIFAKNTKVIL